MQNIKQATICLIFLGAMALCGHAAEETIRGILEKTIKPNACAQITDALSEIYYIVKTEATEKLVADYIGKNIKVVITGTVTTNEGDATYFFNLKSLEKHELKLPPAPPPSSPPPPSPPSSTKTETKTENPSTIKN